MPKFAKIVGPPTKNDWSQVLVFEPDDEEQLELRGRLFLVCELSLTSEDLKVADLGLEFISKLQNNYFASKEGTILAALENALQISSKSILEKIAGHKNEAGGELVSHLGVVAAVVWGKVLYLAKLGNGSIKVVRSNRVKTLLWAGQNAAEEVSIGSEVRSASGFLEDNDWIMLFASGFEKVISDDEIANLVSNMANVNEFVEEIAPKVHSLADPTLASGIIVNLKVASIPTMDEALTIVDSGEVGMDKLEKIIPRFNIVQNLSKILNFPSRIFAKLFKNRAIYARDSTQVRRANQKTILIFAFTLLLVLAVSIGVGVWQKSQNEKKTQFNVLFENASERFDQGQAIAQLNPPKARELTLEAQKLASEAKNLGVEKSKLEGFLAKIDKALVDLAQVQKVEADAYFDFGLIKSGAKVTEAAASENTLFALDSSNAAMYSFQLDSKASSIVAGGEDINGVDKITIQTGSGFGFAKDEGILRIDLGERKVSKVIEKDENWQNVSQIYTYAGNLYLLDLAKNQIYKYIPIESGFATVRNFIKDGVEIDLSSAKSMVIDGFIWILLDNGQIVKLSGGLVEPFEIVGIDKPFGSSDGLSGDERSNNLYVMDKSNSRVVVINKDNGQYQTQYESEIINQSKYLYVDEPAKKMYLVTETKVFTIDLK